MAPIPEKVMTTVRDYLNKLQQEIPIEKAIVFGSLTKGIYGEGSDIDLAIFSDHFESMSRADGIAFLLKRAAEYPVDLEPIAFTYREYAEKLGIVDEIIRTGIDVSSLQ